ncbi:hypothetical protein GPU96_01g00030 [Encephalitozoon hellem]|uniref:Uncharacterized protein n=1 Tax=Encephalitozoon hellem TaxID=27973 RepID=A0A9Q9C8C2_ENCHE|nr:hypothetical protein GPU96_01g00030 [Encephalitozoon hellem]
MSDGIAKVCRMSSLFALEDAAARVCLIVTNVCVAFTCDAHDLHLLAWCFLTVMSSCVECDVDEGGPFSSGLSGYTEQGEGQHRCMWEDMDVGEGFVEDLEDLGTGGLLEE